MKKNAIVSNQQRFADIFYTAIVDLFNNNHDQQQTTTFNEAGID